MGNPAGKGPCHSRRCDLPIFTAILFIGFFLRTFRLDSIPAGLTWDEGGEGLDAADVLNGHLRVFFTNNGAHEPALAYLHAASLRMFGWSAFSLRLPNVFVTTLALAATFLIARRLFNSQVAWIAAFLEAVTFWQLASTRLATRAPMLIILGILAIYWVDKWLRGNHPWRPAALCGAFTGLAQYVYTPARFLVVVVALAWLAAFVRSRSGERKRLVEQGSLAATAAGVVFAPLGWYFWWNPDVLTERATQVSIFNPSLGPIWLNGLSALKTAVLMFGVEGEPGWDRDIAHQPMLDPILAALFFAGIALALRRWRQPSYLLALIWLAVMLLPMVLTSPSWPDFGRAMGIVPAMFLFPAIAVVTIWQRWSGFGWFMGVGAVALLAASAWQYFGVWASAPGTRLSYRPAVLGNTVSAIGSLRADDAPSAVYLGEPSDHDALTGFVIAGLGIEHPELRHRLINYDAEYATVMSPPDAESYVVGSGNSTITSLPPVRSRASFNFEGAVQIEGYDLPATATPGQPLTLQVLWRPGHAQNGNLTFFAHLLDYTQQPASVSFDHSGFPASEWRGGETVLSAFPLALPADVAPGAYWVEWGAYDDSGRRLLEAHGDNRVLLGPVVVTPATSSSQTTQADLSGYAGLVFSNISRTGNNADVVLTWQPEHVFDQDYSVFVHVLDSSGKLVAQADGPPAEGRWPTRYWVPGASVADVHHIPLAGLAPGKYSVAAGMYQLTTGERLASSKPGPEPNSVLVGEISLP